MKDLSRVPVWAWCVLGFLVLAWIGRNVPPKSPRIDLQHLPGTWVVENLPAMQFTFQPAVDGPNHFTVSSGWGGTYEVQGDRLTMHQTTVPELHAWNAWFQGVSTQGTAEFQIRELTKSRFVFHLVGHTDKESRFVCRRP